MTSLGGWAESAGSDELHQSLVFKIPAQSTAVQKRIQTEFSVSGSSTYSPSGQRVIRFPLTDAVSWIQPDSAFLKFTLRNDTASAIVLAAPVYGLFSTMRVYCSGQPVESLEEFGKTTAMVKQFVPARPMDELFML